MRFTIENLRASLSERLQGWKPHMTGASITTAYGSLVLVTIQPLLQGFVQGNLTALQDLGIGSASAVGATLIANHVQRWLDSNNPQKEIVQSATTDSTIRDFLDELLEVSDAVSLARSALSDTERDWFEQTLRQELQELGNLQRFAVQISGSDTLSQGQAAIAIGGGAAVHGDVKSAGGNITTVYAGTVVIHPPSPAPADIWNVHDTPQAYDETASGRLLCRERLAKDDFTAGSPTHRAVKPPRAEEIAEALRHGSSIAIQGLPGSGKSALAAWVNWTLVQHSCPVAAFQGRDLQQQDKQEFAERIERLSSDHILLFDDIHLIEDQIGHIKSLPWSGERCFLLLGRIPYVEKALRNGKLPKVDDDLITITAEDSRNTAVALAEQCLLSDHAKTLIDHSGGDLVLTKWLLESVIVEGKAVDIMPDEAAAERLKDISKRLGGGEVLRLLLTLATFGWTELWCPQSFLEDTLGFDCEVLDTLVSANEAERQRLSEAQGGFALRLRRHPKLCELFCKAAPSLIEFSQRVVGPTCKALAVRQQDVGHFGLGPLVLAAALTHTDLDLSTIEWRLIYGERIAEYASVVGAAAELTVARHQGVSGADLPDDEILARLKLAFAAANGERRIHGAQSAIALLEDMKGRLGVADIPPRPFPDKGYMLYQDAYLMRLSNAGQPALDRFAESAAADEEWAMATGLQIHRGKAAMSRIAACAYRIDLAVFAEAAPATLQFDRHQLTTALGSLQSDRGVIEELLGMSPGENEKRMLMGFHTNVLCSLAETAGWLGDDAAVNAHISALGPETEHSNALRLGIRLARGISAFVDGQYGQVIEVLRGQHLERVSACAGECAGTTAVLLALSYLKLGLEKDAEEIRDWLISDHCPSDAGNGLAKEWALRSRPA